MRVQVELTEHSIVGRSANTATRHLEGGKWRRFMMSGRTQRVVLDLHQGSAEPSAGGPYIATGTMAEP